MNSEELQKLAQHSRSQRETGIALVIASGLLALFLFLPVASPQTSSAAITIATPTIPNVFTQIAIEAKAAIVYDLATGETLYNKNADAQLPLASLTKLLTIYAALTQLSPNTPITIPASAINLDGPHAFSVGQTFSLADLARLTLTASLNDGAVAIANAVAVRENRS
ncbi:MAG: D-alanyl-D-alanine carboxypeptidase, partial [Patescibacteria group bacterium]